MTTAYEPCSRCGGSGMQDYGESIRECSECGGNCMVRARDGLGRFVRLSIEDRRLIAQAIASAPGSPDHDAR